MKLARKMEFTAKARKAIHLRDKETCVFCAMEYRMEEAIGWAPLQIMHVVPRSQIGMGIEQNGVLGCVGHHILMDNGNEECREEMLRMLEDRMKLIYPGWTRESVTYQKHGSRHTKAGSGSRHTEADAGSRHAAEPGNGFQQIRDGIDEKIPI